MIKLSHISKSYNNYQTYVVKDVCLEIKDGETLVLLGSSGSGKTTLLQMINRQINPSAGEITISQKSIDSFSVSEMRHLFGYVFQGIGLFPHMTVEKNIGIVLELMKEPFEKRKQRAHELLDLVGLKAQLFAKRYPDELSGGQQQRVGVARALAANPKYLLMDEPFGALDAITRTALQDEVIRLKDKLKKTIVFVTHDILEAFKIADQIAVMHHGTVQQIGTKAEILNHPETDFVRELIQQQTLSLKEFYS